MNHLTEPHVPPAAETVQAFDELRVGDAMSAGLIHCAPETRLTAVARLMATHGVHAVFVFDYGDEGDEDVRLWGVVSDLDLAAAAAGGVVTRTARESSVTPLVTVGSDEPVRRAAELMAQRGVSHLAVLDAATGRPAGVLSTLDIARVTAGLARPQRSTPARAPV
ncbi:MAG TPA: CBS domain-containing protein [Gaiellaceae bacterium]|jgi:CBS domain-containing membrane protein